VRTCVRKVEPILARMADRSMARAHAENVKAGRTDYASVDGGFTAPRNAHGCSMAGHAADGRIVDVVHKRLTDVGAKSSKSLETLCFIALLACARFAVYTTVVMDGCRDLIEPTLAAGKRAQGDLWHVGKNWAKWAELAIKILCRRPQKTAAEKADNPKVAAVKIDASRLEKYGSKPKELSQLEYARQRVRDLGGDPRDDDSTTLKRRFHELARAAVMTVAERTQEVRRQAYLDEVARRKAATTERERERANVAATQKAAMAWRRDLRSMQRYVAEHTRGLRNQPNPSSATDALWTDTERHTEFNRLWRVSCVDLILGRRNSPTLKLLNHPATHIPGEPGVERKELWQPKGEGFVKVGSFLFDVLYSLIHDPVWVDKFAGLIDGRMTFMNESFFHTLRKWGTNHSHFSRYYSLAIWCSVLNWNENVTRAVVGEEWKQSKSGQLKSSAGRFYCVPVRVPPTDHWRSEGWAAYLQWARGGAGASADAAQIHESFYLGWKGAEPPTLTRTVPTATATAAAAQPEPNVDAMDVTSLKAELAAKGLPDKGKKAELQEAVRLARADLGAARQAQAVKVALRELPPPTVPQDGSPTRCATAHHTGESDAARPLFGLPSPYRLPTPQRPKRKAAPKGQLKLTATRAAAAVAAIARGEQPAPLKRHRTEAAASAAAATDGANEADEESPSEGEEGDEDLDEDMGVSDDPDDE
jgi:hypothetical protein